MNPRHHTSTTEMHDLYVPRVTGCTAGVAKRNTRPCAHLRDVFFSDMCNMLTCPRDSSSRCLFFLLYIAILTCPHTRFPNIDARSLACLQVCFDNEVACTLVPCGHHCCCRDCAGRLTYCPVCRARITEMIKAIPV